MEAQIYSVLVLIDVVVEQLGDEVDVRQDHAAAAVPVQTELVQREALDSLLLAILAFLVLVGADAGRIDDPLLIGLDLLDEVDVLVVLVADNLNQSVLLSG